MHADSEKLLWDAQQAAGRITRFTANKQYVDYEGDELLRSAVERQFEIIGEAFSRLAKIDAVIAGKIPDLPRIVAFRNVLIHGYATVDNRLVWGVIKTSLGSLRTILDSLLAQR